jgi:hypothetical protein
MTSQSILPCIIHFTSALYGDFRVDSEPQQLCTVSCSLTPLPHLHPLSNHPSKSFSQAHQQRFQRSINSLLLPAAHQRLPVLDGLPFLIDQDMGSKLVVFQTRDNAPDVAYFVLVAVEGLRLCDDEFCEVLFELDAVQVVDVHYDETGCGN